MVFAVPSGNLGNLTAGVIAQRLGVPVGRFVAATNVNDVLPDYLRTGVVPRRDRRVPTISNAMDVGDPSNFPRLLADPRGGARRAARERGRVCRSARTETQTDDPGASTAESGYLLDPHSAVGVAAAGARGPRWASGRPIIALATAHPAKFGDVIREELGFVPDCRRRGATGRRAQSEPLDLLGRVSALSCSGRRLAARPSSCARAQGSATTWRLLVVDRGHWYFSVGVRGQRGRVPHLDADLGVDRGRANQRRGRGAPTAVSNTT